MPEEIYVPASGEHVAAVLEGATIVSCAVGSEADAERVSLVLYLDNGWLLTVAVGGEGLAFARYQPGQVH